MEISGSNSSVLRFLFSSSFVESQCRLMSSDKGGFQQEEWILVSQRLHLLVIVAFPWKTAGHTLLRDVNSSSHLSCKSPYLLRELYAHPVYMPNVYHQSTYDQFDLFFSDQGTASFLYGYRYWNLVLLIIMFYITAKSISLKTLSDKLLWRLNLPTVEPKMPTLTTFDLKSPITILISWRGQHSNASSKLLYKKYLSLSSSSVGRERG